MGERITFWYGCNVMRHGDIIHSCVDILRLLGFDVQPAGGPDYCCGTVKDANQTAADGMARRTVGRFNQLQRERVVAWCPSCHTHMNDFMSRAYETEFGLSYLVDVLYEHRERLAALLARPVPMRVLLHKHMGFNTTVAVNSKVPELLALIPGVEVVEDDYLAPGYMCSLFAAVPAAMADIVQKTLARAGQHHADAVVVTYHQCYRELCALEADGHVQVFNYIQLLAQSLGLPYTDEYKAWKKSGAQAGELIGAERVERVGVRFFERAMLPELVRRPPGMPGPPDPKEKK